MKGAYLTCKASTPNFLTIQIYIMCGQIKLLSILMILSDHKMLTVSKWLPVSPKADWKWKAEGSGSEYERDKGAIDERKYLLW